MAIVQLGERQYRVYAPSLAFWPAARWVLVEDEGPQVQFRSRGDIPTVEARVNEARRTWLFY